MENYYLKNHSDKLFICLLCDKGYKIPRWWNYHIRVVHDGTLEEKDFLDLKKISKQNMINEFKNTFKIDQSQLSAHTESCLSENESVFEDKAKFKKHVKTRPNKTSREKEDETQRSKSRKAKESNSSESESDDQKKISKLSSKNVESRLKKNSLEKEIQTLRSKSRKAKESDSSESMTEDLRRITNVKKDSNQTTNSNSSSNKNSPEKENKTLRRMSRKGYEIENLSQSASGSESSGDEFNFFLEILTNFLNGFSF
jgi:hypothetical protein